MNKSPTTKPMGASDDGSIVDKAKQTASNVATQAKGGVHRQIEVRKEKAVGTIHDVAEAVRTTGKSLEGPLPKLAERAADGIDRVSRFLDSHELTDAVRGVERFARREPALFLGGAVALGVLAGRFLKSSARSMSTRVRAEEGDMAAYDVEPGMYAFEGDELDVASEAYSGYADDIEDDDDQLEDEPIAFEADPDLAQRTTEPVGQAGPNVDRTQGR